MPLDAEVGDARDAADVDVVDDEPDVVPCVDEADEDLLGVEAAPLDGEEGLDFDDPPVSAWISCRSELAWFTSVW